MKNNTIITEDGQRLTVDNGLITGTEDAGKGLAYETGNVMDEKNGSGSDSEKNSCGTSPGKPQNNTEGN
jgi:hypothetical protein